MKRIHSEKGNRQIKRTKPDEDPICFVLDFDPNRYFHRLLSEKLNIKVSISKIPVLRNLNAEFFAFYDESILDKGRTLFKHSSLCFIDWNYDYSDRTIKVTSKVASSSIESRSETSETTHTPKVYEQTMTIVDENSSEDIVDDHKNYVTEYFKDKKIQFECTCPDIMWQLEQERVFGEEIWYMASPCKYVVCVLLSINESKSLFNQPNKLI